MKVFHWDEENTSNSLLWDRLCQWLAADDNDDDNDDYFNDDDNDDDYFNNNDNNDNDYFNNNADTPKLDPKKPFSFLLSQSIFFLFLFLYTKQCF